MAAERSIRESWGLEDRQKNHTWAVALFYLFLCTHMPAPIDIHLCVQMCAPIARMGLSEEAHSL